MSRFPARDRVKSGPLSSGASWTAAVLATVLLLGACGGGDDADGTSVSSSPSSTSGAVPAAAPSSSDTSSADSESGSGSTSGSSAGSGDGPWPCSLIPAASVATLVEDPTLDDSKAGELHAPSCTWASQVNDGDRFDFQWDTNKVVLDAARHLGTPVGDLGDEAFYQQTRMNVGSNVDRAVVQTRLFITFGEQRVLLLLRSEDAALPQDLIAVGRALLAQCQDSKCAKPKAAAAADRAAACDLVTAADLANVGLKVAEGETPSDKPSSCAWTSANADKPSFFVHQHDEDFAHFQKNEYYDPLPGVGQGALIAATTIYFHNGGPVYSVVCAKGCTMSQEQRTAIAKIAAGRL